MIGRVSRGCARGSTVLAAREFLRVSIRACSASGIYGLENSVFPSKACGRIKVKAKKKGERRRLVNS